MKSEMKQSKPTAGGGLQHMVYADGSGHSFKEAVLAHLKFTLARDTGTATRRDWWIAVCEAVEDVVLSRFSATMKRHNEADTRRVYYLSLEYLMGRLLQNNIVNAGILDEVKSAVEELGLNWEDLVNEELDMGLGNGGLGRLAACFLDSLATLDIPAVGYGIHYQFGLFKQEFVDGHQIEHPDNWRQFGNPWEVIRPEYSQSVRVYGHVEHSYNDEGDYQPRWVGGRVVEGVPYDVPICGYGGNTVNFLRLWEAKSSNELDLSAFNEGGYVEAVRQKALDETISKVLYPNDKTEVGKELRLVQQYFFVACSLKDIIRRYRNRHDDWTAFADKVAIQLNDTHPALAVPELMRVFLDDFGMHWDEAWKLVTQTLSYTNHTLLPEALERWSVALFEKVLPRHLQIIFEINARFLQAVDAKWPGDDGMKSALSIIEEGEHRMVRMAYLSVVASHTVNGVAALHTELLKKDLFQKFDQLYPGKIRNKTNGITPRRWLLACNPGLSELITEKIGDQWPYDLNQLKGLESFADDAEFQKRFMQVKHENKCRLAEVIKAETGIEVDPTAMFDVQIKRLHEYKRQHLNLLHILSLYRKLVHNPDLDIAPRVFIFGAKAAPGYDLAKNIIRAINKVGDTINHDPRIQGKLKVVFLPNYRVSLAEAIIPAADLSEQISTAGKEASGTGNMKLALNGALTIGTLDGANVEIEEEVGSENIFIFGLRVEEVDALKADGYNPWDHYYRDPELRAVMDWLSSRNFTPDEEDAFRPIRLSLLEQGDPYLVLADFSAYCEAQEAAGRAYLDRARWAKMAILNTARVGKFSSDRTIREYCEDIWKIEPLP